MHLRKHLPEDQKKAVAHACKVCQKTYSSVGKLHEHMQKHEDIRCQFCNATFAYIRTCRAHEKESCPNRPGAQPVPQGEEAAAAPAPELKRWYCHICNSDYGARRNLKKHLNIKHDGAEVAKDAFR